MRVINLCFADHANFSFDNAESFKVVPRQFGYERQSRIMPYGKMLREIERADVVQIMHSDCKALEFCLKAGHDNIVVYHTGTTYRQDHETLNSLFNPHVKRSFIALGEFAGLGAKNETYIVGAIDTNKIKASDKEVNELFQFSHYPSNPKVKGTETIIRLMGDALIDNNNGTFTYSTRILHYQKQLARIAQSDIYIELFAPEQNGKPYGSWGITALEAAALGKVVVTNHLTEEVYYKTYEAYTPFITPHTESEFIREIEMLCECSPEEIKLLQYDTRDWVNKYHSYKATGNRLKSILEGL